MLAWFCGRLCMVGDLGACPCINYMLANAAAAAPTAPTSAAVGNAAYAPAWETVTGMMVVVAETADVNGA